MSETIVKTGSRWRNSKTGRPCIVRHGNEPNPIYVMGAVLGDKPGDRVTYQYTDRTSRVMPCIAKIDRFLAAFERAR